MVFVSVLVYNWFESTTTAIILSSLNPISFIKIYIYIYLIIKKTSTDACSWSRDGTMSLFSRNIKLQWCLHDKLNAFAVEFIFTKSTFSLSKCEKPLSKIVSSCVLFNAMTQAFKIYLLLQITTMTLTLITENIIKPYDLQCYVTCSPLDC